jgi:hypothetical protein
MPKTSQLVLSLQSKRGVLAGIGRALAEAKVNILSLSAAEAAGRGKIRMVVNKPTLAKRALRKARVRFVEEVAFAKRLSNKPGALARVADKLARGGVNIKSASRIRRRPAGSSARSSEGGLDGPLRTSPGRAGKARCPDRAGPPAGDQRSARKNARMSAARASGCSSAAKWPPAGIVVQRWML